ncbi:MAG: tRNA dihydrouridine synthase DusB [Planctomycetia bacterium]|nr:tRNA dihydrouridine synthase DusB [Planctomycetia bacterium]
MLSIGNQKIDPPVIAAPMADLSDWPWRSLLRSLGGAGLLETEMISARSFVYCDAQGKEHPARLRRIESEEGPLSVQIWDNDPIILAQTAARLVRDYKVKIIDLNFGCPAPKIVRNSASGSWLLRDPEKVGQIIEQVVKAAAPVPITAKIRLGLTQDTINAVDVAQAAEGAGASALTVHGRTASQLYRGSANWDEIARIKPFLRAIPLIGNGDIRTVDEALDRLSGKSVDGIMIGRAALERPWIFRQIQQALLDGTRIPDPDLMEQKEILLRHFRFSEEYHGPEKAVLLMRRFACFYAKGKPGGRSFRTKISQVSEKEEFLRMIEDLFNPS